MTDTLPTRAITAGIEFYFTMQLNNAFNPINPNPAYDRPAQYERAKELRDEYRDRYNEVVATNDDPINVKDAVCFLMYIDDYYHKEVAKARKRDLLMTLQKILKNGKYGKPTLRDFAKNDPSPGFDLPFGGLYPEAMRRYFVGDHAIDAWSRIVAKKSGLATLVHGRKKPRITRRNSLKPSASAIVVAAL